MMYIDRDEGAAARRAEWLTRLVAALCDAERAVRALMKAAHAPDVPDLLSRIGAVRAKLEAHQRGPGAYALAEEDEHLFAHIAARAVPMHDHVP